MENQMEKNMKNEMGTGMFKGALLNPKLLHLPQTPSLFASRSRQSFEAASVEFEAEGLGFGVR